MWVSLLLLLAGFGLIAYSADRFVDHAAALARLLGVSPLVIGLTVVAVGSSAPELLVSCLAAVAGNSGLAVGNAVGSNIANVGLVLGLAALVGKLSLPVTIRRRELPIMLLISLGGAALMANGDLNRGEGAALLTLFVSLLIALVWSEQRRRTLPPTRSSDGAATLPEAGSPLKALGWTALSLALLLIASQIIVVSAVDIATAMGISPTVIGLTVVALGTSLPEVAASLAAALKGHHELAVGNVVGSNIANLLMVLGAAALLNPATIDSAVLYRDLPVMLAMAVAVYLLPRAERNLHPAGHRLAGALLLGFYLAYIAYVAVSVVG